MRLVTVLEADQRTQSARRTASLVAIFTRLDPFQQCIGLLMADETILRLEEPTRLQEFYKTLCRLLPFTCSFYGVRSCRVAEVFHKVFHLYVKLGDQGLLQYLTDKICADPFPNCPDERNQITEKILDSRDIWDSLQSTGQPGIDVLQQLLCSRIFSLTANNSTKNRSRHSISSCVLQVLELDNNLQLVESLDQLLAALSGLDLLHLMEDLMLTSATTPSIDIYVIKTSMYRNFLLRFRESLPAKLFQDKFPNAVVYFFSENDHIVLECFIKEIRVIFESDGHLICSSTKRSILGCFVFVFASWYFVPKSLVDLVLDISYGFILDTLKSTEENPQECDIKNCVSLMSLILKQKCRMYCSEEFSNNSNEKEENVHQLICNAVQRVFIEGAGEMKNSPHYVELVFEYLLAATKENLFKNPAQLLLKFVQKVLDAYPPNEENPFVQKLITNEDLILSPRKLGHHRTVFSLLLDRRIFFLKSKESTAADAFFIENELSKLENLLNKDF